MAKIRAKLVLKIQTIFSVT